jgi:hypothetical protein
MRQLARWARIAAGLALLAAFPLSLQAQSKAAPSPQEQKERAARGEVLLSQSEGGPDLISGPGGEFILRYPVAHWHAMSACLGWLYIALDTMRYEVLGPPQDMGHAFELKRSDLTGAQQWRFWGSRIDAAEFKFRSGGTYHFSHVRKRILQSGNWKLVMSNSVPYQDLIDGSQSFDDVVATMKARMPPPPAPPAPPPTISMLEPAGAEEGKTVSAYDSALHLRGIASQASGITSVSVNGQSAFFKPLAPQTVEFDLRDLPLSSGVSAVVVVATATDKSVGQMTFKVSRSEVRVLEPGAGSETADAAVKVRGLAVGFPDVDRVEVAGQAATLQRRADGTVEFEAANVPLTLGPNALQGYVLTRGGLRQSFSLNLKRNPPPGPPALTLAEVENALANLPKKRVAEMVEQYGVDFALNDETEKRLRDAGADASLLLAIAKAKK